MLLTVFVTASARAADKITFEDHLLPILRNECTSCHNPDKKKAGLDLSTYQATIAGSDSGAVATASDPDASLLYKVVAQLEDPKMPKGKGKLPDKDIAVFKQWIAGGMLENASGKAVAAKAKPKVNLTVVSSGAARPAGAVAMPKDLSLEPVIRTRRPGALMCLAASPWAPLVALGGRHQVVLYDTNSLDLLGVLPFPEGDPYVARFSRNGGTLLVGGGVSAKSGRVVLFDVATGNRVTQVGDEFDAVLAADLAPDQSTVALGGPGKTLKIYATADGQLLQSIKKHTDWVTAVAYSPDGVLLASGDRQGGLWVWEARSANEFYGLTGHKAAITAVAFRDDSNILASASEDGTVKLWDMPTGKLVKSWNAHPAGVTSLAFTHDGRIVTSGRDKLVRLWKPDGSALPASAAPPFPDIALHAAFDAEGKRVVAGDWSGAVHVFDAATAKQVGEITADPPALADRLAAAGKELAGAQAEYDKSASSLAAAKKAADEAARRLELARTQSVRLKAAQARSLLAAAQARWDSAKVALLDAKRTSENTAAELVATRKLVEQGSQSVKEREDAVARAAGAAGEAERGLAAAQAAYEKRLGLARDVARVAQQLADAARAEPRTGLAAASAKAKSLFDALNQELEAADRAALARSRVADSARAAVAAARAEVEAQRARVRAAPARVATLAQAVGANDAELAKRLAAERTAAAATAAAKKDLEKLDAEYRRVTAAAAGAPSPTTSPVAQKK